MPVQVVAAPGLLTVFFARRPVRDYAGAQACDLAAYGAWCRGLLARGVYPPPSQFEAWFPSLAHDRRARRAHDRRGRGRLRRAAVNVLAAVADAVRAEGGLLADALVASPSPDGDTRRARRRRPALGRPRGRRGLRRRGHPRGRPPALRRARASSAPIDPDLALLAGDRLYALGLARLARLGDVEAVRRAGRRHLAVRAGARRARAELAEAVWAAGATAVGWGPTRRLREAKAAARAGDPAAAGGPASRRAPALGSRGAGPLTGVGPRRRRP